MPQATAGRRREGASYTQEVGADGPGDHERLAQDLGRISASKVGTPDGIPDVTADARESLVQLVPDRHPADERTAGVCDQKHCGHAPGR